MFGFCFDWLGSFIFSHLLVVWVYWIPFAYNGLWLFACMLHFFFLIWLFARYNWFPQPTLKLSTVGVFVIGFYFEVCASRYLSCSCGDGFTLAIVVHVSWIIICYFCVCHGSCFFEVNAFLALISLLHDSFWLELCCFNCMVSVSLWMEINLACHLVYAITSATPFSLFSSHIRKLAKSHLVLAYMCENKT